MKTSLVESKENTQKKKEGAVGERKVQGQHSQVNTHRKEKKGELRIARRRSTAYTTEGPRRKKGEAKERKRDLRESTHTHILTARACGDRLKRTTET
jgi:hypothetical protein